MPLESASFINQLNSSNPNGADLYSTADDHLRLIKAVLLATLPNLNAAMTLTSAQLNAAVIKNESNTFTSASQIISATGANLRTVDGAVDARLQVSSGGGGQVGTFSNHQFTIFTNNATRIAIAADGSAITFNGVSMRDAAIINTGTFADARVAQSNVTQHQAALALAASQTTSGTFADARISQSSVVQHQAALALAASQITSGTFADARIHQNNVLQHQAALALAASQITSGTFVDARIASTNVLQHQGLLALTASQITLPDREETGNFSVSAANHNGRMTRCNAAGTITVTVGNDALGGNNRVAHFTRWGAGAVNFATSGVTIRSVSSLLGIAAQYTEVSLWQLSATEFLLVGSLG